MNKCLDEFEKIPDCVQNYFQDFGEDADFETFEEIVKKKIGKKWQFYFATTIIS